jgi:glycosyltransferase involved in cell wall biosynthesis
VARARGIEDRVRFTGPIENVQDTMARFACLALPSAYEGFPNVALEAVAMGVPVVAAPVGDVEDIVLDGRTGYLMTEPTSRALADLLIRAVGDTTLRQRAGKEGPELVREKHSVDAAVDRLTFVYRRVTGK